MCNRSGVEGRRFLMVMLGKCALVVVLTIGVIVGIPTQSMAQQYASADKTSAARGHFGRARALLIEALAEFEDGKRLANPDLLIDTDQWRLNIVSRAEDLNRVLDPKPRVTRNGVRFKASSQLIRHDSRYSSRNIGPKSSNTAWEEERAACSKSKDSRASLQQTKAPATIITSSPIKKTVIVKPKQPKQIVKPKQSTKIHVSKALARSNNVVANSKMGVDEEIDAIVKDFTTNGVDEDPELLKAIEDAVQDRLGEYSGSGEKD